MNVPANNINTAVYTKTKICRVDLPKVTRAAILIIAELNSRIEKHAR